MLRNLVLSTKTRAELEEYIERRQLLLSSWTREVDKHGDHTPWYKLAAYLGSSFYTDEVWQESDNWCLIHYLNNYEAVYELPSYGFSFIFNRSGRIRPKSSLDSGYSFFMVREGEIENVIKMINMYCEIYHMYKYYDDLNDIWSFGIQEYIHGVQNDGLYVNEELFWRETNGNQ